MPPEQHPRNIAERTIVLAQGEPDKALQIGEALLALARADAAVVALAEARQGAQERNARPLLWTLHRSSKTLSHYLIGIGKPHG